MSNNKFPTAGQIKRASAAGKAAFHNGIKCAPCLDANLLAIAMEMSSQPMGTSIPVLEAWTRAWTTANLSEPVSDFPEWQSVHAAA